MRWLYVILLVACTGAETGPKVELEGIDGTVPGNGNNNAAGGAALTSDVTMHDFGSVDVGTPSAITVTLTNGGAQTSGSVSVSLMGTDATQFSLGNNGCASKTVAAAASCSVTVTFQPSSGGGKSATLRLNASPGGETLIPLSGTGTVTPASLSLSETSFSLGTIAVGSSSGLSSVTVSNTGSSPSGIVSVSVSGNTADAQIFDNCNGLVVEGLSSCTISFRFAPMSPGTKSLSLTVSASPGGGGTINASANGVGRLTVIMHEIGATQGTVTGTNLNCTDGTCTVDYPAGGNVSLSRSVTGGVFNGWLGECTGTGACNLDMNSSHSVQASFSPTNVMFVTSTRMVAPFGATEAEAHANTNAICNTLAHAAGHAGNFVSWISTTNTSAASKITVSGGWVTSTGLPVFASKATLISDNTVNPLHLPTFDENGVHGSYFTVTGTTEAGVAAGTNCADFTGTAGDVVYGDTMTSSFQWTRGAHDPLPCDLVSGNWAFFVPRMYCMQTDHAQTAPAPAIDGRRAFVSLATFSNGAYDTGTSSEAEAEAAALAAADAVCQAEAGSMPGAAGTYKAFIATNSIAPASRFNLNGTPWHRRDGVQLAETPTDFVKQTKLWGALNIISNGQRYAWYIRYGGQRDGTQVQSGNSCGSWRSSSGTQGTYWSNYTDGGVGGYGCDTSFPVWCLEL